MSDPTATEPKGKGPRRIHLPWWALAALGAGVGFLMAEYAGAVMGGVLGFFAWKLR